MNTHKIEINPISGSSRDEKAFINFPKKLYDGCELYVPQFDMDMRLLVRKRHPFFLHSDGDFLLLRREGIIVGRCLITENTRYNDFHKTRFAFFDCFDIINDRNVAEVLFEYLSAWARKRGLEALVGPMLSGGANGAGILIKGFDHPPAMTMMRYNYPYYRELLEGAGFKKYLDLHSFSIPPVHFKLSARISRLAETVLKRNRFGVLRFKNKAQIRKVVEEVKALYASTLNHHLEDYPLSAEELEQVKKDLLTVIDPDLIALLTYDGRIIGYVFGFADITAALHRNKGHLGPLCILRILRAVKKTDTILFNGIGILPEYQRLGGNALLYRELERMVNNRRFSRVELVQISERTKLMISDAESLHAQPYKIHRMYKKDIHE